MASNKETARATIILNGSQANATLKEIEASARALNAELRKMPVNSKQFEEKTKDFTRVKQRLADVRGEINGTESAMSKFANGANKYFQAITLVAAAFVGVGAAIKGMIDGSAKLSDAFADIQKTSGLSAKEVKELSSSLGKLNTRSAKKELLELGYVAGKLGYTSKADILGFVKAADQINVALAKDIGGNAEEAIRQLGKLTDTFKIKQEFGIEQALLKTGSAINALGAASTANEGYMVEFTKRIGGIAPQAGISIANILGLGATLDQLGQSSEMSATALSQLIVKMFRNTSEYAKIAELDVGEFSAVLKKDANEALIMFLGGLQKNKGGLQELSEKFKDLGIDGSRAIGVIGALSNNIEVLRRSQQLSNSEFEKGTSLTNEFNVKNNNMAGNLEKVEKWMRKLFVNSAIMTGLGKIVKSFADWVAIPVSRVMQDEYTQVNVLASKLSEANLRIEDRNKLYEELIGLAPTVLEGIDKENISINRLKDNLRLFNQEMINKIILQKKDEQIVKWQETAAEKREERVNQEMSLRKELSKVIQKVTEQSSIDGQNLQEIYMSQVLSIQQKRDQVIGYIESHAGVDDRLAMRLKTGTMIFRNYAEEEAAALAEIQRLLKEKDDLSASLGLNEPDFRQKPSPGSTDVPDPAGGLTPGMSDEELRKAKEYAEYLKKITLELQQARARAREDELQRELELVDANLEEELSKITGHSIVEEDLRVALREGAELKKTEIRQKYLAKEQDQEFKLQKELLEAKLDAENEYSQQYIMLKLELLRLEMEHELQNTELTEQQRQLIIKAYRTKKQTTVEDFDTKIDLRQTNFEDELNRLKIQSEEDLKNRKLQIYLEVRDKYRDILATYVEDEAKTNEIRAQMAEELAERQQQAQKDAAIAMANSIMDFVSSAASAFSSLVSTINESENAQLQADQAANDKKKENLKARLDAGLISQSQYDRSVTKMDQELDQKKRKLQHDQAVRAKELALVNAIINVAQGVTAAFTAGPIIGIVLGALTAALGVIQIGYILNTKVPEAATGRYNVIGEESGRRFSNVPLEENPQTGFVSSPLLIGETGEEMVIDPATTKNLRMNYPQVIQAIQYARVPQAASGRYVETTTAETPGFFIDPELTSTLKKFNEHVEKGIQAYISYDHLRDVNDTITEIESSVSNS